MVSVGKGKVRWVVGLVVLVFVVSGCFGGKDYRGMRFDADNLEELTEVFFPEADEDTPCVGRLGSVRWERSGGNGNTQGLTVKFIYDKEGYRYSFFYVQHVGEVDPYHLTVRVHRVEGYKYLYSAALRGNRFRSGIGTPIFEEKWKRLLDDDVREDLDRQVPDSEQERWNRKVLEEYTGVLRCFFDERGRK